MAKAILENQRFVDLQNKDRYIKEDINIEYRFKVPRNIHKFRIHNEQAWYDFSWPKDEKK